MLRPVNKKPQCGMQAGKQQPQPFQELAAGIACNAHSGRNGSVSKTATFTSCIPRCGTLQKGAKNVKSKSYPRDGLQQTARYQVCNNLQEPVMATKYHTNSTGYVPEKFNQLTDYSLLERILWGERKQVEYEISTNGTTKVDKFIKKLLSK